MEEMWIEKVSDEQCMFVWSVECGRQCVTCLVGGCECLVKR